MCLTVRTVCERVVDDSVRFRGFRKRWASRVRSDFSRDDTPEMHGLQSPVASVYDPPHS